ncbi:hypothetical protein D3H55_10340 [Bacillus salacetis]|uniref:DUF5668 domain-containing protein n=1 Tax=Bacillus salacetis TaxID=2315464 RepID=A0A3A1QYX7_9BACI|nr:hypothetical protein [Bacillus salacetis]RIW33989.1 hypothetical protein D3H55_10340 [Bacillus salacetis]
MRVWRVGSISMGAALVILGMMLLLTQIFDWDAAYVMSGWWPFILVILGGEMLFYLFFTKQENARVKYDLLSIIFAAVIGTAGIGLTVLQATGMLGAVKSYMTAEERTMEIPAFTQSMGKDIKRIVVDTGNHDLTIEGGTGDEISLFGTYRSTFTDQKNKLSSPDDYLQQKIIGDSLYITLKGLPAASAPFENGGVMNATLVVPSKAGLEVSGNSAAITMKPRQLLSNWSVTDSSDVKVMLSEGSDIHLLAENITDIKDDEKWKFDKAGEADAAEEIYSEDEGRSGSYTVGDGTYDLVVRNAFGLSVVESR